MVKRGFPLLKNVARKVGEADPPEVIDLMKRVEIVPVHAHTLFGPTVTIHLKDGRSFTKVATGREFIWDFDEEVRRVRELIPGLPIPKAQFEDLIEACRGLDGLAKADKLIELSLIG